MRWLFVCSISSERTVNSRPTSGSPFAPPSTMTILTKEWEAQFVLVCVGIGEDGFGRYVLAEQETLTPGVFEMACNRCKGTSTDPFNFLLSCSECGKNWHHRAR